MSKKFKKFIFPGTTLIVSVYISVLFATGIIIGYLSTIFFDKKFLKTGRINSLVLNLGKWKIHLHHWLLASFAILITYFFSSLSIFWIGIFGGLALHDIYTDKKWYKVIYKKKTVA